MMDLFIKRKKRNIIFMFVQLMQYVTIFTREIRPFKSFSRTENKPKGLTRNMDSFLLDT